MKTQLLGFNGEVIREAHIAKTALNAPPILCWKQRFFSFSITLTRASREKILIFKEVGGEYLSNLEVVIDE